MFSYVWYKIVRVLLPKVYTPEQIAEMLQLSKNTVYELINRGEIIAKKIGKVYRIPANSVAFAFSGLDFDLYQAEQKDLKNLPKIQKAIVRARKKL
ncbi:MAG: helix-turn-helix domain-containing protein [Microgenomates group bacterium]